MQAIVPVMLLLMALIGIAGVVLGIWWLMRSAVRSALNSSKKDERNK